ncbi:hypothetical protein LCGC14_2765970, partial [marine sediment metagenome]
SEVDVLHRFLIPLLQFLVEGDVLVDGQRFPARVPGDELSFGVGQAGIAGQPSDALVAEGMGRGPNPGLLCVLLDDLLHAPR